MLAIYKDSATSSTSLYVMEKLNIDNGKEAIDEYVLCLLITLEKNIDISYLNCMICHVIKVISCGFVLTPLLYTVTLVTEVSEEISKIV